MTDPQANTDERVAFGAMDAAADRYTAEASSDSSQHEWPSRLSSSGTSHEPAHLDRPAPSNEPLRVRFEKAE